jgi:hypothetical protein
MLRHLLSTGLVLSATLLIAGCGKKSEKVVDIQVEGPKGEVSIEAEKGPDGTVDVTVEKKD